MMSTSTRLQIAGLAPAPSSDARERGRVLRRIEGAGGGGARRNKEGRGGAKGVERGRERFERNEEGGLREGERGLREEYGSLKTLEKHKR